MTAAYKTTSVTGSIIPVNSTRLRILAQTYSSILLTIPAGAVVAIDRTILYLEQDPAQPATMKGDLWGDVLSIAGVPLAQMIDNNKNPIIGNAFMAIDYHGEIICRKQYVESSTPPVEPPVDYIWAPRLKVTDLDANGNELEAKYYILDPNQNP